MTSSTTRNPRALWAATGCALMLAALFQFYGNSGRGYIDSASLFFWWGMQWSNPGSETEHGWLILGLSAWLLWRNLGIADGGLGIADRVKAASADKPETGDRKPEADGARSGDRPDRQDLERGDSDSRRYRESVAAPVLALLVGLALHVVGFVAQQARVSIIAFLLCLWGVLRLGGGRRWGAAALFPLGFLVFAIPVNVLDSLGFWLRVWVVDASAWIAHAVGIDVIQSGTQLVAPDGKYNYDVAAACSGVRSLTAMTALSLLAGYLNFRTSWRRAAVLGLCFPFVYLGNVARIVAIVVAAEIGGTKWGDIAHEVMGYGVFAIVLGGVLGGIAILRRVAPERIADGRSEIGDGGREMGDGGWELGAGTAGRAARPYLVAGFIVAVACVATAAFLHRVSTSPVQGRVGVALAPGGLDPVELPAFVGTEWIGRRTEVTAVEREILPADTGFSRKLYVALGDRRHDVLLSIVLSGRDRTSIHRPELCLVGQGWTVTGATEHRFALRSGGPRAQMPATLLRVRREVATPAGQVSVPQLVAYWFVDGEQVVASHWGRVWRDSWNRVRHGRVDRWAYVLMQTDASEGEAVALARMQAVLDGTLTAFQRVR